jgi:transposase InsO family protein
VRQSTPGWTANTDQGSQFTSAGFTGGLEAAGIRISMDGRGRWLDNVFVERLWRSLKYEEVHLKVYADGREARAGISAWVTFYNTRRPHQALGQPNPDGGLAGRYHGRPAGQRCGHAAALGRRWRAAHIPTATAAATVDSRGV